MDFEFTDEQRLLRDSVDRLLSDHYDFAQRRGYLAEPEGWSTALWSRYAEQGLLGLPFAEVHGSFTVLGTGLFYTAAADRAPDLGFGAPWVIGRTC